MTFEQAQTIRARILQLRIALQTATNQESGAIRAEIIRLRVQLNG